MKHGVVMGIVFLVDYLLLSAVERMSSGRSKVSKRLTGAFFGACFAAASLLPGAQVLRMWSVHSLSLLVIALSVYGCRRETISKTALFLLLHLSTGQATASGKSMISMLLGTLGICLACLLLGSRERYVPVELTYRDKHLRIQALRDTGNALTDPVTGQSVLVVSRQVAQELTGLTARQLEDPITTMETLPGLRLIPYRTVGNTGFLVALRLQKVRIGTWQGSAVVAFSPQQLGANYEALTGGMT